MKWITPHKYPSSFTGCRSSLTKMSVFWSEARNLDLGVWKPLFCLHKKHILKHVMFNCIEFLFSALQFLDLPEVHFYSHLLGLINSTVPRCRPEDQYRLVPGLDVDSAGADLPFLYKYLGIAWGHGQKTLPRNQHTTPFWGGERWTAWMQAVCAFS